MRMSSNNYEVIAYIEQGKTSTGPKLLRNKGYEVDEAISVKMAKRFSIEKGNQRLALLVSPRSNVCRD